jgi:hypothetical protein
VQRLSAIESGGGGKYQVRAYRIGGKDFINHVQSFVQISLHFEQVVGLSDKEVADFAAMALPLASEDEEP